MTFTIHREAPKAKLVTMGQGEKEMGKEPVADYYPPGTTEPIVRPAHIPDPALKNAVESPEGAEIVSKEPASKAGPVGKDEPKGKDTKKK